MTEMRAHPCTLAGTLAVSLLATTTTANAAEFAFSSYGLGAAAFGAGVVPPPGTYLTNSYAYYQGEIGGPVTLGGVLIDAGFKVDFFSAAVNGLYVPERKLLGGQP